MVTSAGFHLEDDYYYILKDETHFNMGVTVSPQASASSGFCPVVSYETAGNSPPAPPSAACPGVNGFTVTFCPTQAFPPDADVRRRG
ncbi:hypothetical protein BDN71DRAFT_1447223 [Pleurotus eryngii]|uniref:Uncharacterized protein n=1 Tax=Pleurotus eryngii TaxID=5323 RepID=A0A9P5ZX65_PLEER|nr:hypothetical protein BDN71DRAFT_1447223 [Pleurotus eryngii]